MEAKIRDHIRSNVVGYVALFFALSLGTAYATHPGGANTISSGDIINGEVKNDDLDANSVGSGKINDGGVQAADLAAGAVGTNKLQNSAVTSGKILDGGVGLADLATNSVDSSKVVNSSLGGLDLAGNSINSPKVVNDSLFGVDVREDTLSPLDGHDAFDDRCDPTSTTFVKCAGVEFFLQRSMPVLTIYNWAQWSDNDQGDRVAGICRTRLDGSNTSGTIWVGSESATGQTWRAAATPVVDVLALSAGTHSVELWCSQNLRDIVFGDIRIAVVELGAD
ncbi:MAG TPA: hypothetical protein VE401_03185 [Solirubrobacterales bacterium]|jgi:hypothetical protein|nr:hypothetical protein [Solirubrobacterales bacterium]